MSELTLAVTSTTGVMAIGLGRGTEVLAEASVAAARRHAEEITPAIVAVLAEAEVAMSDIDRLVVDVGPGLFTGLRVGLATVRGLAFALDVPVVGLTSLAILAGSVSFSDGGVVTAVIDARRNEVFQQVFVDGHPAGDAEVGGAQGLAGSARGVVVGDGLDRYREFYELVDGLDLRFGCHPSVEAMLVLADGQPAVAGTLVSPFYLREPDVNPNVKVRPHG